MKYLTNVYFRTLAFLVDQNGWKKCICQKTTRESLQCPANSKRKDAGAGYISFMNDINILKKIGIQVPIDRFPEEDNERVDQLLLQMKASWHKSCRDLYNNTKLQQTKKRKLSAVEQEESKDDDETSDEKLPYTPVKSRRSSSLLSPLKASAFSVENVIVL